MRKKSRTLTEQELEIMKVVWDLGEATVRQVYEIERRDRQVAYTTTMTMMKILEEKGYLEKSLDGRAFLYRPTRAKSEVVGVMVDDFVERVFNGAAGSLVLNLIKDRKLSGAELDELSRLVEEEA